MTDLCRTCGHPRHTHGTGPCVVKTVGGPPSTKGRAVADDSEHTGRTVTPCGCEGFVSQRNGIAVHA